MVRSLTARLNKAGIQTDVLTFNMTTKWQPNWHGAITKLDGATVYKVPALNWHPLTDSKRLNLAFNLIPGRFTYILKKYDILHYHEFDLSFPLFAYPIKKPKIFHLHGLDTNFLERYPLSRIFFTHSAHFYIAISKIMKKNLTQLGIPKERVIYLPNGIDTKEFVPKNVKDKNLLLYVGRISPEKGLSILIKALKYIRIPTRLIIVGPSCDPAYYREVKAMANTEAIAGKHKVDFVGGLEHEKVLGWYQKASLTVLPSLQEGLPVVALESLACETPVVATNVGGTGDIITDGENGYLVPPHNPQRMAEKIEKILSDASLGIEMGQQGRRKVTKDFSIDVLTNKLHSMYERILSE